jgi:hypothetical protein
MLTAAFSVDLRLIRQAFPDMPVRPEGGGRRVICLTASCERPVSRAISRTDRADCAAAFEAESALCKSHGRRRLSFLTTAAAQTIAHNPNTRRVNSILLPLAAGSTNKIRLKVSAVFISSEDLAGESLTQSFERLRPDLRNPGFSQMQHFRDLPQVQFFVVIQSKDGSFT